MSTIIGNTPSGRTGPSTGSGSVHRRLPFGHLTIAAKAGETVRISSADLFEKVVNGDIAVQLVVGAATVSTTLADVDIALNAGQDAGNHWVLDSTPVVGAITQLKTFSTALKISFSADSVMYVVAM